MKKIKNITILRWGIVPQDGHIIKKQKVKFPNIAPIFQNWDKNKLVGNAMFFKTTTKGIVCDIEIEEKALNYSQTIAPAISRDLNQKNQKIELLNTGLVMEHIDKKLNNNITMVKNE